MVRRVQKELSMQNCAAPGFMSLCSCSGSIASLNGREEKCSNVIKSRHDMVEHTQPLRAEKNGVVVEKADCTNTQ